MGRREEWKGGGNMGGWEGGMERMDRLGWRESNGGWMGSFLLSEGKGEGQKDGRTEGRNEGRNREREEVDD